MFQFVCLGDDIRIVVVADEMNSLGSILDLQPQLCLHAAAAVAGAGGVEISFGFAGNLFRHEIDRFGRRQNGSGKKCDGKEKYLVVHEVKPFKKFS